MDKSQHLAKRIDRQEAGQSLILIVLAFVALLLIVGLALDLGLVYIERIKLGRACDAAALAAAQELPFEDAAIQRAMQYMRENGYGPDTVKLALGYGPTDVEPDWGSFPEYISTWNGPMDGPHEWPIPTVWIDTASYRDATTGNKDDGISDKILVTGRVLVNMNFMIFAGFEKVPVEARALAENVNKLDVVIVLDESGSMNDDTYCWDCFLEADDADFPDGYREYLPYASWVCEDSAPIKDFRGYDMLVAEAEYFTASTSLIPGEDAPNEYHRDKYTFPKTFWMLQRTENSQASGYACRYDRRLECGAHLMHMPHRSDEDVPGHTTPYTPANAPAP
ncbi:MAG: hypothetical protein JXA89_14585, partial [Anaerolineae bacterium]|nr:hypothetical protein [Anaerolineae bacterium]